MVGRLTGGPDINDGVGLPQAGFGLVRVAAPQVDDVLALLRKEWPGGSVRVSDFIRSACRPPRWRTHDAEGQGGADGPSSGEVLLESGPQLGEGWVARARDRRHGFTLLNVPVHIMLRLASEPTDCGRQSVAASAAAASAARLN